MLRRLLGFGLATMVAAPALAQAPAAPPPAWAQGRPAALNASPLAPNAPKLTVTPADQVPVGKLTLPQGFKAEIYAAGMPGARMMALAPDGTLFIGTRTIGRVYAVKDGKTYTLASGLKQPTASLL